jgi:hypothetical protein
MKIALCFSGQIRTGNITAANILRYIGDLLPNCNIFVHTWDTESISQADYALLQVNAELSDKKNITFKVNPSVFADFYKTYNPVAMEVTEYDLLGFEDTWGGRRINPVTGVKGFSFLESIYEANELKKLYEQKNHFTYDYVVRIRPDLIFSPRKSLRDDLALITAPNFFVYGANRKDHGNRQLEDIYWMGTSATMDVLTDYYNFRMATVGNAEPGEAAYRDSQHDMAAYMRDRGYDFSALANNELRIYYHSDRLQNVDPLAGDLRFTNS